MNSDVPYYKINRIKNKFDFVGTTQLSQISLQKQKELFVLNR